MKNSGCFAHIARALNARGRSIARISRLATFVAVVATSLLLARGVSAEQPESSAQPIRLADASGARAPGGFAGMSGVGQAWDAFRVSSAAASVTTTETGEPIVSTDAVLSARRARTWGTKTTHWLLLDGDVEVAVGAYAFTAQQAVVRIDYLTFGRLPVKRLAFYLDEASSRHGKTMIEGPRVLVTAATTGRIELKTDLLDRRDSSDNALVIEADDRINGHLAGRGTQWARVPGTEGGAAAVAAERIAERARDREARQNVRIIDLDAPGSRTTSDGAIVTPLGGRVESSGTDEILPASGVVTFGADRVVIETKDENENIVVLLGGVRIVYHDDVRNTSVSLTSENAVIFLDKSSAEGALAGQQTEADSIRGIYLEDNVIATDGQYTVRAPRVYYDLTTNQALVLEAVMFTWDAKRKIPIYIRAEQVRQVSRNQWSAKNASLTTTAFADPLFAIGAERLTVTQEPAREGQPVYTYEARDAALRISDVPVVGVSKVKGQVDQPPLRRLSVGTDHNGVSIETEWDMFTLTGMDRPQSIDWTGNIDYLGDRGPGVGTEFEYTRTGMFGKLDAYVLVNDNGEDDIGNRDDVEFDGDTRGFVQFQHREELIDDWEMTVEAAYVSDPTFLEEFFRSETVGKDYETVLYFKKQRDDWAFTAEAGYRLHNHVPQLTTLQSPGYTVDKVPELGLYNIGRSFLDGALMYYGENRFSRMRIRAPGVDPDDYGFTARQSMRLFGIVPPGMDFGSAYDAAGVPDDYSTRFDTRHELQMPFEVENVRFVPYVFGRFTAYDENFEAFSGEDENERLMGGGGLRIETELSRAYSDINIRALDVQGIRHIVEPSMHLSWTGSTVNPEDIPYYDAEVEALSEGVSAEFGLRNTLQTRRGGAGRWRTVDWLMVDTQFVMQSNDSQTEALVPRYYSWRPEYSIGGDHFNSEAAWMLTDSLAVIGQWTYSFEHGNTPKWRIGGSMDHTPNLRTYMDYTELDPYNARLLTYGFTYELTRTWTVGFEQVYGFGESKSREINVALVRTLPQIRFGVLAGYDEIDDEYFAGIVLVPVGIGGGSSLDRFGM